MRQDAGTYLSAIVPAAALLFALVLPVDLQIQLIEPAVGTVEPDEVPTKAAPEATLPSTGVTTKVPPLLIAASYVIVIAPFVVATPTLATFLVGAGRVQPEAKGAPFAAFSETAVFAEPANDKPSVTLARTV